jgi:hypothetical protein
MSILVTSACSAICLLEKFEQIRNMLENLIYVQPDCFSCEA